MTTKSYTFLMMTSITLFLGIIILTKIMSKTVVIPEFFFNWPIVFIIIGSCLMLNENTDQFGLFVLGIGFTAFLSGNLIMKLNFYKISLSSMLILIGIVIIQPILINVSAKRMKLNNFNNKQVTSNKI